MQGSGPVDVSVSEKKFLEKENLFFDLIDWEACDAEN